MGRLVLVPGSPNLKYQVSEYVAGHALRDAYWALQRGITESSDYYTAEILDGKRTECTWTAFVFSSSILNA